MVERRDFSDLKEQVLPILISPRADNIPRPIILTTVTSLFLYALGIGTIYLYNYLETSQSCQTFSIPIEEDFISSCSALVTTQDFRIEETIAGVVEEFEVTVEIDFKQPQEVNLDTLVLSEVDELLDRITELVQEGNDIDFLALEDIFSASRFETVLENDFLTITYSLDSGLQCNLALTQNDLQNPTGEPNLVSVCSDASSATLRYENHDITENVVFLLSAYLRNIHTSNNVEAFDTTLIKNFYDVSAAFCCIEQDFPFLIGFGFFAGIFFALEGYITFFFAFWFFRKKDIKEEKNEFMLERYTSFTKRLWRVKGLDITKSQELKQEEEKRSATVSCQDIQRIFFNPRCRTIRYASFVSTTTFALVATIAVAVSFYLSNSGFFQFCDVLELDLATNDCEIDQVFTSRNFVGIVGGFPNLPSLLSIQFKNIEQFTDREYAVRTSLIGGQISSNCENATNLEDFDFCLDLVSGIVNTGKQEVFDNEDTLTSVTAEYELPVELNPDEFAVITLRTSFIQDNVKFNLFYSFENENIIFNAEVEIDSEVEIYKQLNVNTDELVSTAIIESIKFISFASLEQRINVAVECCQSSGFLEFFGISLGYLALLEGPLTVVVALLVYAVTYKFSKK